MTTPLRPGAASAPVPRRGFLLRAAGATGTTGAALDSTTVEAARRRRRGPRGTQRRARARRRASHHRARRLGLHHRRGSAPTRRRPRLSAGHRPRVGARRALALATRNDVLSGASPLAEAVHGVPPRRRPRLPVRAGRPLRRPRRHGAKLAAVLAHRS
ncbi:hypothetical protein NKH77_07300 [Streptomyces sp. M19]